jgi:hypothetical protein
MRDARSVSRLQDDRYTGFCAPVYRWPVYPLMLNPPHRTPYGQGHETLDSPLWMFTHGP